MALLLSLEDYKKFTGKDWRPPQPLEPTHYLVYVCELCGWPERIGVDKDTPISIFPWTKECRCPHCGEWAVLCMDGVYSLKERESGHQQEYVYIFQADNGLYKIGRSMDPGKRLKAFDTGPTKVTLVWQKQFQDAPEVERAAHRYFREYRIRGEWFALESKQVDTFIAINSLD